MRTFQSENFQSSRKEMEEEHDDDVDDEQKMMMWFEILTYSTSKILN